MKTFWVTKYSPKDFGEYCFSSAAVRTVVKNMIDSEDIPHLLLVGDPGTGKSTLARLLIEYNNIDPVDVLTIDATLENNVDVVRDRISLFATTSAYNSDVKIVLLEEFDYMSTQAQNTLREIMVRYSDVVRFILTANAKHKVVEAIQSRSQTITFDSMSPKAACKRLVTILEAENVEFDVEVVEEIVAQYLPDLRKMINVAQQYTVNGVLTYTSHSRQTDYVTQCLASADFESLLKWVIEECTPVELSTFYTSVFNNINSCESIASDYTKLDKAIVSIAKYQHQHPTSSDGTICAAALVAELRLISKGTL